MIDIEDIRKEIAVKHNTLLPPNDPVLMIATMTSNLFEKSLEKSVADLNAQQEANLKSLINALQQGNIEAKNTARLVIKEAAGHVSEQVHVAVSSAMDEGRENLRKDLEYAWENIEKSRKAAMNWAIVSGICMAVTAGMIWFA